MTNTKPLLEQIEAIIMECLPEEKHHITEYRSLEKEDDSPISNRGYNQALAEIRAALKVVFNG